MGSKTVKFEKTKYLRGGKMMLKKCLRRSVILAAVVSALFLCMRFEAFAGAAEEKRVNNATEVLQEIMAIPEKGIPPALFHDFYGVAVFPKMIKVGFVAAGRYGKGILVIHTDEGRWSYPVFIELFGGSVGFQIGVQSTDVILVFKTKRSIEGILKGKFTMGADAAVAAGPVGREASADTDIKLKAEIYSYSRSRGLFAGVSLEGSGLQVDEESNGDYYGQPGISAEDIFAGKVTGTQDSAQRFIGELEKHASKK
jgi:lipid-binding SYLF domain-containing protein